MRDVIWTVILIWLVYKIVDVFKGLSSKKDPGKVYSEGSGQTAYSNSKPGSHDNDIKKAVKNHLNNEGEYVDFEEVK